MPSPGIRPIDPASDCPSAGCVTAIKIVIAIGRILSPGSNTDRQPLQLRVTLSVTSGPLTR